VQSLTAEKNSAFTSFTPASRNKRIQFIISKSNDKEGYKMPFEKKANG
jgi:hypothetical protein